MVKKSTSDFPQEALGLLESHQSSVTGLAYAAGRQDNPVTLTSAVSCGLIPAAVGNVDTSSWTQKVY